jgi:hypothetical protein
LGYFTEASGDYSTALGHSSIASGPHSTAIGASRVTGDFSASMGYVTDSRAYSSLAIGRFNDPIGSSNPTAWIDNDPLFIIGHGSTVDTRSNALVVTKDSNIFVDAQNSNTGNLNNGAILFGGYNATGEGIASKRMGGGNLYSLDFYTNFTKRLSITNDGEVQASNNLTVQNGKGIVRNTDGTQLKKLSTNNTVNTGFSGGETKTFAITWPETFSASPEAYVGNVSSGTGGWAEVVMTIASTNSSGATLYVFNPRSFFISPNFTIKIIAIGAQ